MAIYFSGQRLVKEFSQLSPNGRERLDWRVVEHWRDIDEGTATRCGVEGTCSVEVASGITEKAMSTLKEVAGGTLGLKDVWSLKYDVEQVIGREVNWEVSTKSTKTFRIQPPKCGRSALTVYQLFRTYEITTYRKKLISFSADKWLRLSTRTIDERTNNHDAIPDVLESDPRCNCKDSPPEPTFDGLLALDLGGISLRVPYRITQTGLEVQIDRRLVAFPGSDLPALMRGLENGLDIELESAYVPEPLLFLGKIGDGVLTGRMARFVDTTDVVAPFTSRTEDQIASARVVVGATMSENYTSGRAD